LILAHGARGFCAQHTVEGIGALRGLGNVYFDTSAICEPGAFEAILREFGPRRLMFGTDFTVSNVRGRCVSVADGFYWMYENNVEWGGSKTAVQPTLVGIESLLALKQACGQLSLRDSDVERIFSGNARELLGITKPDGAAGQARYTQAKQLLPGGTQLLSKRPEMYAPGKWPAYFAEARGVEVTDSDGRRFVDMTTMGVGTCLLGYADPDVNAAVCRRVMLGSTCTLNSPEEVELAEMLLAMHPWAQKARFARSGGEAMAIAVRIARARTRRDVVAFCGYHGWSDWYLAANLTGDTALDGHLLPGLSPAGVPAGLAGTALPFAYNKIDELAVIVKKHGKLGAVVMEPRRSAEPAPGFLQACRELANQAQAPLIIDEITAGFRLRDAGGAHLNYGLSPDIAVFAKALGNGFPVAAIIGTADVMDAAQDTFISSTLWTEGVGPAAAVATVKKFQRCRVAGHVAAIGQAFRTGLAAMAEEFGLPLKIAGPPALTMMSFDHPDAAAIQTLWTVRMLERGFLAGASFYPSLAHEERHVAAYLAACDEVFRELAAAVKAGDAKARIGGAVKQSGFARLV
jgi:glutamate-1-semialdehyde 2,1-aminomutase